LARHRTDDGIAARDAAAPLRRGDGMASIVAGFESMDDTMQRSAGAGWTLE